MQKKDITANRLSVIVVAAGTGSRMRTTEHKQFLKLRGVPVLAITLNCFEKHPLVDEIVLVTHPKETQRVKAEIVDAMGFKKISWLVPGGKTRTDSVKAGLAVVSDHATHVAVHDGARPLVTLKLLDKVFSLAMKSGAAIPVAGVIDTIKRRDDSGLIVATLPRNCLWAAQTPQVFRRDWIVSAYEKLPDDTAPTDDAAVLEAAGYPVYTVEGSRENIKITEPADLLQAEMILAGREDGPCE